MRRREESERLLTFHYNQKSRKSRGIFIERRGLFPVREVRLNEEAKLEDFGEGKVPDYTRCDGSHYTISLCMYSLQKETTLAIKILENSGKILEKEVYATVSNEIQKKFKWGYYNQFPEKVTLK
jgi:hypothetical protein